MLRKENGVTLVALVITIIVLLILAGVTISMVLGDDGIIGQATGASKAQAIGNARDAVNIALASMRTEDVAFAAGVGEEPEGTVAKRLVALLTASEIAVVEEGDNGVTITVEDIKDFTEINVAVTTSDSGNYTAVLTDAEGVTL